MRRFLLSTDFSPACYHALNYIIQIVKNRDIKVDLVSVFDIPLIDPSQVPRKAVESLIEDKQEATEKRLKERMESFPDENKGDVHTIFGVYPSTEISEFALENAYDLVVMALRQKYGLLDRMIGSITAHTIYKSKVPVLAIPLESTYKGFNKVLVPSSTNLFEELNEGEEKALEWLVNFWELFSNPEIHLLHVEKVANPDNLDITFNKSPYSSMKYSISHASSVHDGIMKYITENSPDLLAFYKPHRSFWERLYHRSDTQKLLYELKIPMLIFS